MEQGISSLYLEANGLHTADDEMATEHEVGDFLWALVRLLKPLTVLETGCYFGHASRAIGSALWQNKRGHLQTCDTDEGMVAHSRFFQKQFPITVRQCKGVELAQMIQEVDLAFLDSSGDRVSECAQLQLTPKACVVVHDTKRPQYDAIRLLKPWKVIWNVDTSRGLTVFSLT